MAIELRGLEGKNVLITGAAKGQGSSHAKAFAEAGCDVALLDITHPVDPDIYVATPEMLAAAAAAIEECGRSAVPLACDVRNEDEVATAVGKALAEFGGVIGILVNNAGVAALDAVQHRRRGMRSKRGGVPRRVTSPTPCSSWLRTTPR
jgi:(-)-trans-carveol dehydrogenase